MYVWPSTITSATSIGNNLTFRYILSFRDSKLRIMAIKGGHTITMVDNYSVTIATHPTRPNNSTSISSMNWCTFINTNINTGMVDSCTPNWMCTIAIRRSNFTTYRPTKLTRSLNPRVAWCRLLSRSCRCCFCSCTSCRTFSLASFQ